MRDSGARLIEVGDGQQGQPVRAGGLWNRLSALAQQACSRGELTTIVRARDPADRRDQVLFRQGQHRQACKAGPTATASRSPTARTTPSSAR